MPNCVICGQPIDGYRLAVHPHTKTCSPEHSRRHAKNLRNRAARHKRAVARERKRRVQHRL